MRGRVHTLRLLGQRAVDDTGTVPEGNVAVDAEGIWHAPGETGTVTEGRRRIWEGKGFIGPVRVREAPNGESFQTAAHLPIGTEVHAGDDLEAVGTGDPNVDGLYEITGVQPGPVIVRVLLKRHA